MAKEKKPIVESYAIGGTPANSNIHYLDIIKKGETKEVSATKDPQGAATYPEPNYPFDVLLKLSRLSAYHQRCLQIKAALTCLLGYELETDDDNKDPDDVYNKIKEFFDAHSTYADNDALTTLYNFCYDRELFGNGFLEAIRATDGTVAKFFHIPARYCRFKKNKGKMTLEQGITDMAEFVKFGTEKKDNPGKLHEFIHWKTYSPDDIIYGEPDYVGAIKAILLDDSAGRFNIKRFDNNMVLEHVITLIGASFDSKTKRDIKDFFSNNFKGIDNAGKSLILEVSGNGGPMEKGDVEINIEKIAAEQKEASYLNLRKDVKEEQAAAHGVPPRLVGIMAAGQLGGTAEVQEQMRMFRDMVIRPRQLQLEFILNKIINAAFPDNKKWKVKLNIFDINDAASDASFYSSIMAITDAQGKKVLNSDEIRQELGYAPIKDDSTTNISQPANNKTDPPMSKAEKILKSFEDLSNVLKEAIE